MYIKTLKKIVGVLFAISKDLKAIRKALEEQNKPLVIQGEVKPFKSIEEFQKYTNSHEWIEDYIDERLAAKKHRTDYLKSIKEVDEAINKDQKES